VYVNRLKKQRSKDYQTQTRNLGEQGFNTSVNRARAKRASDSSSHNRALAWRKQLHADSVRAYIHYVVHGDHQVMSHLVLECRGSRTRAALIGWVASICSLRWDESHERFRGKRSSADLTPERATRIPISWRPNTTPIPLQGEVLQRCKVCGGHAIPGEDICYHHQSE
jgi:hypothetical protein